ncbi:MAG: hypothetical protein DI619_03930 [Francisella sp.]|nr:MAG: hypothetical protein DI619_03930 [Francisella sp.]
MPNIHVFYLLKRLEKILIALNGRCTLYLSGILACQKAIMKQNNAVDKYDINHNLSNFFRYVQNQQKYRCSQDFQLGTLTIM